MAQPARTIASKLYLCFGAAILVSFILAGTSFYTLSRMKGISHDSRKMEIISAISVNVHELLSLERAVGVRAYMKDHAFIEKYHGQQTEEHAKLKANLEALKPLISTPAGQAFMEEFADAPARYAELDDKFYQYAISDDLEHVASYYKDTLVPYSSPLPAKVDTYQKEIAAGMDKSEADTQAALSQAMWLTGFLLLVGIAVGAAVIFVVRRINADLRGTALELGSGAEQIASAAAQVSSSSQTLAQGASEQAASIEETSASSEQINAMAQRNTENSKTTAGIVASTALRFVETSASMADMVLAMSGISESSEKISRIIKVIDQIAFQTNILALNAAVEAARAGESGAGFAVVAEEVRNLAQRSAQAAQDTASLIEESITRSQAGSVKVDQVASVIHAITAESAKMKLLVDQINDGSQEQSRGIDQVTRSIRQMEVVTQGNAASAEQSAAAAQQLTAQSESVKQIVANLNALVGGGSATTHRATPNLGTARKGAVGKANVLASFKAVAKPRSTPIRPSHAPETHDTEASFQEF